MFLNRKTYFLILVHAIFYAISILPRALYKYFISCVCDMVVIWQYKSHFRSCIESSGVPIFCRWYKGRSEYNKNLNYDWKQIACTHFLKDGTSSIVGKILVMLIYVLCIHLWIWKETKCILEICSLLYRKKRYKYHTERRFFRHIRGKVWFR